MRKRVVEGAEGSAGAAMVPTAVALYEQGWSIRRISVELSASRPSVRAALEHAGIDVAPQGRGRPRPATRIDCPEEVAARLRELYVDAGMGRREVADALGLSESRVRRWLEALGIERRTRGRWSREDRSRPPPDHVERLYVEDELPAREVGKRVSTRTSTVLDTLHERGIAVRLPHSRRRHVLLEDLYGDPLVRQCLARHGVPVRADPGPLPKRFPVPVPLEHCLLRDLYEHCGLALMHIELLTGQPEATVRRHLGRFEIPSRNPGGLSPFSRRVRRRG